MSNPIMPKTFAAYIHPLQAKKNYTSGSDGQAGLSEAEATKIRNSIATSPLLDKGAKAEANAQVDQALALTQAAKANDGKVDTKELNGMLALAKHDLKLQPLNRGSAAPMVSLGQDRVAPDKLRTEFFQVAAGTSYAPISSGVEGGSKDCMGKSLKPHTLDKYVAQLKAGKGGPSDYVGIAMDSALFRGKGAPCAYGDIFRIPEVEKAYGVAPIYFGLVDTGGAFGGTKGSKVDICCDDKNNSKVQQSMSLHRVFKPDGQALNIKDLK
ncbi:MAG: hypothetical protein CVV27_06895 [Candidatus Melainabacteria bacterium HGW-Melainabacteria-1]|nr:MAG: hypothetical protein CVV27_06895 [Candidatus Melainabacteria bacterium HGW-Melainabacteria-1]